MNKLLDPYFFAYFPYFEKVKWTCGIIMLSVCLCIPPINFGIVQPNFMKLGIYIMPLEPISTACFINHCHQSVCLYVYPLSLLGNGSVKASSRQRIYTQQ
jgi:hypothetical protein